MSTAVSIVMAVYNGSKFLLPQVASITSQLEPGDELIVVDDASSDDSVALLKALQLPHMRIYVNSRNQGIKRSFERGLSLAREEIIFLSDQDDVWLPGKRSAFVAEFERKASILVVISDAEVIDADDNVIAKSFMAVRHGFKSGVAATLLRNRYIGCAMAVRRSLLRTALPIPRGAPMQDMWLGLLGRLQGGVVYLSTPYIRYRRHGTNDTPLHSQVRLGTLVRWRFGLVTALMHRMFTSRWGRRAAGESDAVE